MMMDLPRNRRAPRMIEEEDEDMMMPEDMDEEDTRDGKLLALQNMLDSIAELSDEDLRPYVENLKNNMPMRMDDGMPPPPPEDMMDDDEDLDAPKIGVDIEMGAPDSGMPEDMDDDEDDEDMPKDGFLAILSKKMKSKK